MLSRAYDLPSAEYSLGALRLRPYSMATHRRAGMMELVTVAAGLEAARDYLSPMALYRELDALHWLLAAPLDEVRGAFLAGGAPVAWSAIDSHPLPAGTAAGFAAHIGWILSLCREALFDAIERETPGDTTPPPAPPDDLKSPGMDAHLVVTLCSRLGCGEEHLLEWIPFPRILKYSHAIQWTNPYLWTVAPRALQPDPYGDHIAPDPGHGDAVEF